MEIRKGTLVAALDVERNFTWETGNRFKAPAKEDCFGVVVEEIISGSAPTRESVDGPVDQPLEYEQYKFCLVDLGNNETYSINEDQLIPLAQTDGQGTPVELLKKHLPEVIIQLARLSTAASRALSVH